MGRPGEKAYQHLAKVTGNRSLPDLSPIPIVIKARKAGLSLQPTRIRTLAVEALLEEAFKKFEL